MKNRISNIENIGVITRIMFLSADIAVWDVKIFVSESNRFAPRGKILDAAAEIARKIQRFAIRDGNGFVGYQNSRADLPERFYPAVG